MKMIEQLVKDKNLKLELVDYLLAARIGDTVLLNKHLYNWDKVYCLSVVEHEIAHSDSFNGKDVIIDLFDGDLWKSLKFCFRHPKAFLGFIPVQYHRGKIAIDLFQTFFYLIIIVLIMVLLHG